MAYFKSDQAQDVVMIAQKILQLIETEKSKRPLTFVVDPTPMGIALENANEAVKAESKEFIKSLGL